MLSVHFVGNKHEPDESGPSICGAAHTGAVCGALAPSEVARTCYERAAASERLRARADR